MFKKHKDTTLKINEKTEDEHEQIQPKKKKEDDIDNIEMTDQQMLEDLNKN